MPTLLTQPNPTLPPPPDYAPYQPGPFRLGMDLHPLDLANWIEIDDRLPRELAEKRRLLSERRTDVFAARPAAAAASAETLALLIEHLLAHFPHLYQQQGDTLHNRATGEVWPLAGSAMHPLELAGRLVQEDLCLLGPEPPGERYLLTGASLCFPSRWRLHEKLGHPLDAIHAPVPGYDSQLAAPMDRLFGRLKVTKPVWRVNWSVVNDPALFQPYAPAPTPENSNITPHNAGNRLWLRLERQTLRRLPRSQDILFTIRVYVKPLADLAARPERARQLAAALRGLAGPMRHYKDLQHHAAPAIAWLESVSAGAG